MSVLTSFRLSLLCRVIFAPAALVLVLAAPATLRAATIQAGNVTTALGPTFFLDEATNGGGDADINQPSAPGYNRSFAGLLTRNQGPTRVTLTGFGFAAHTSATANDATTVAVTVTYLGADELVGGGDDVVIGTASGSYSFTLGGEYVFAFDTPLSANLTITGTLFRIQIAPSNATSNGSLKLKTPAAGNYEPKLSVAGVASPAISPNRVNLAKFQTMTPGSVAGNRLASYATDGVTGNDNRWQSENWAWNTARINFPFPVEIGSAQLFTGVDDTLPLTKFAIQYLNGSTWVTIPGADISGNTNVERNVVFSNSITATSFRLIAQEAPQRLREFALYPPNGPSGYPLGTDLTINLASQRPAVANSFTPGFFPLSAVDGRTHVGAGWQTTTAGVNTLDIDLVSSTKIGSAHLYSGSNSTAVLADFTLKYWNGSSWVNIPGGVVTGNASADRIITFTTPVTTTQVRLEFTKSGTTPTLIRELQIFPANTENVGYPLGTNINPSGAYADYEDFNDAFYQIVNPSSNRDIAVATGGQPALEQAGITPAQSQYQILLNLSNGTYRLRNRDTGNCLSGAQLSKTPGEALTDAPYMALPHQDWILEPLGGGLYKMVNAWSGLVIDTQGGATSAGTTLVQNTASNAATQSWRLSYDTWAPKKGNGGSNFANAMNSKWFYNWGQNNLVSVPDDTVYHPMQWGSFNWVYGTTPGPIWQHYPTWRKRGDGIHLMGFNEPDRTDQSNIPLADCVSLWPRLMALDQPLVSPSPGTLNPPVGVPSWHELFYTETDRLGYRVEYNAIHTYPGPNSGSSDGLAGLVQAEFVEFGRPIWLTEFSFVDWGGNQSWSEEDNYQCLAEFIWRAESLAALRKYALFVFTADANNPQPANPWTNYTPAPRSNSYDSSGNLTAFGRLYAAWDGDTTIRTSKTYLIHHRGSRKRLANLLAAGPGGQSIRVDGQPVNWSLVSTGVSNRYYVVSSRDGRRLSSNAGAAPTLAAAGTTGVNVEWSLTATQHGWYYLGHPASGRRLQLAYNNSTAVATYSMVANSTSGVGVEWRFVVPLAENFAPVLAAIPPQTVDEGVLLTFTATATDTDLPANTLTYSLMGAPSGAAIAGSTGVFTWTPTEAQGPGSYNFTVRVSDGTLTHDQPVSVTVNEVNAAPVLAAIPAQTASRGVPLTFTASATDADLPANALIYTLVGAPDGAAINPVSGVFTWTPTEAQGPGTLIFTVQVSDGVLTDDKAVSVTVAALTPSPETDSDGDGLTDLLEYAFGTDPALPNASPFRILSANTNGTVTLQFQWNWQATGLTWQIRHGHLLANVPAWPVVSPGTTVVDREGDVDQITITPAMATPDSGFFILEVIEN